jgi:hypothetical protein
LNAYPHRAYNPEKRLDAMPESSERRKSAYVFNSMPALMEFFSEFLPRPILDVEVKLAARHFVKRKDVAEDETRLQFIRKCQGAMTRRVQSRLQEPRRPALA